MPYYKKQGWKEGDFPNAEKYYSRCISIPMYPSIENDHIKFVIERIKSYYK